MSPDPSVDKTSLLWYDIPQEGGAAVPTYMNILLLFMGMFRETLVAHAALAVYLFAVMDERRWNRLKKLPALLLSPLAVSSVCHPLYLAVGVSPLWHGISSVVILTACTLWVRWAWGIGGWQAFAAVCMAGVFQVAASCLSRMLFERFLTDSAYQFAAVTAIYFSVVLGTAALLYRLRFGYWFRLLLGSGAGQRRTALLLFAALNIMELFLQLQKGIQPVYLLHYYMLVLALAVLVAGLTVYIAQRLDAVWKAEALRDVIAQQQLYEQDLEAIRREVRAFRHDYKNLLSGLSQQAGEGELDALCAALSDLDAGFDRSIGEKIQASTQIGNLRIPQVRSLLLSKLAGMGERGIDCRLEVLYPVERVEMDPWDFVRCLGILLDNAAEAALETEKPWVEIVLLAQGGTLSLRVSNPYAGTIDPDRIWEEGFSTKGEGRGLGLPGYQRISSGYPNTSASTSWAGGVFIQELNVEDRS